MTTSNKLTQPLQCLTPAEQLLVPSNNLFWSLFGNDIIIFKI
jgi:hypothetical protein